MSAPFSDDTWATWRRVSSDGSLSDHRDQWGGAGAPVSVTAASVDVILVELRDRMERIEREIRALSRSRTKRLLSKREAARRLGVDRGTTLEGLIRRGALREVMGKIPDTEIERLLTDGLPAPNRPRARRRAQADEAVAIRDLDV